MSDPLPSPWAGQSPVQKPIVAPTTEPTPQKPAILPTVKKSSGLPKIPLVVGGVVILLLAGLAFVMASLGGQSSGDLLINLKTEREVLIGKPFDLTVTIDNPTGATFKQAKISVLVPSEFSLIGEKTSQRVREEAVGQIDGQSSAQREIPLIAVSGSQTVKKIRVEVSYRQDGSSAEFKTVKEVEVLIGTPAIGLDFLTPERILSGVDFETKIMLVNYADKKLEKLALKVTLPSRFQLTSSNTTSTQGANIWLIDELKPGETKDLILTGQLIGEEGEYFTASAVVATTIKDQPYEIIKKAATLGIAAPPLAIKITNASGEVTELGKELTYTVLIGNYSSVAMENVTVKMNLVGELFNLGTLKTDGFVNPVTGAVSWNAATSPSLLKLLPGETHLLTFVVRVKDAAVISRASDKNYVLKVNGQVESPTVLPNVAARKTISLAKLETKVAGKISLESKGYFKEKTPGFTNSGPYPPRVNEGTKYTVHWILRNHITDVSKIEVTSFLEPYARFTGQVQSNVSSSPIYNSASGQLTWRIDKLLAGEGIRTEPIEAIFQIEVTPPRITVGEEATIIRESTVRAVDDFTSRTITGSAPAVTTDLPHDQSIGKIDRQVQE